MKTIMDIALEADIDWHKHWDNEGNRLERFADLVRADEREECAKVCENIYEGDEACGDWPSPEQCAAAIRARGETAPPKEIDPNQWAFDNGLEST